MTRTNKYQVKRTGRRLQVNENYAERKLAQREREIATTTIKEDHFNAGTWNLTTAEQKSQAKIVHVIKENNLPLTPVIVKQVTKKFQYVPDCDIKSHEVLVEYYKIESLEKYMIR